MIHGVEHGFHLAHGHGDAQDDAYGEVHEVAHADAPGEVPADAHGHGAVIIERPDGVLDPADPQDMRNMGGLLSRMPATGWTFIIGGLALSGFPLITAGFWSKDEIFAFAHGSGAMAVFWTLAIAAFITAFYTARQISLTFLGSPRTEGADHAPESNGAMVWPLILIAPFAIGLGWLGISTEFPLVGGLIPNYLAEFLEPYIEYMDCTWRTRNSAIYR